jgi:uncharacterized protein (DUF2147 family)
MKLRATLLALALSAVAASAFAAQEYSLIGHWRVGDGSAVIDIRACGDALCGFVASAPPPGPGEKSAVGQKIILGMKRDGVLWKGPIFNIDDGKTYDGEISLSGPDRLQVRGCVAGGGICGGETWKREN